MKLPLSLLLLFLLVPNVYLQLITTTTPTTTTQTISMHRQVVAPVPSGQVCNVPGDVVFLMDGSSSINENNFILQKTFVANITDNLEIGFESIHVGVIVYSTLIGDTIGLQPPKSKVLLNILLRNLSQPKEATNTTRGIERMRQMMRQESRSSVPKLAVVITDGRSSNPPQTIAQATLAKTEGISILAIGVGNTIFQDELQQIASNPRQVFEVSDFGDLDQITASVRDLICQEIKKTSTTTSTITADTT